MNFQQKIETVMEKNNTLLCVGLDPVLDKLPTAIQKKKNPFFTFNKAIIDATADIACCFKPNSAFYEALGEKGIGELKRTCDYITKHYPKVPILLDFKRGDIGSTNKAYATFAFDYLGVDAVTVQPYVGQEALSAFLERKDKGIFILCKTSNPGSGEFQNLSVILGSPPRRMTPESDLPDPGQARMTSSGLAQTKAEPLYIHIAKKVALEWNSFSNCMLVVGATYPEELQEVRRIVGDMTLLVPGLGTQGGDVQKTIQAGLNSKKMGMILNASREILYASSEKDFAQKAREKAEKLRYEINSYR